MSPTSSTAPATAARCVSRVPEPFRQPVPCGTPASASSDEGWIQAHWHSEGGLQAHDRNIFRTKLRDTDKQVPTRSDKQDFIEAILNGTPVMIDAETGHRVNSQCLLGLAAIHSGKALDWDPVAEKITNHPEAAAHMTGTYRDPWDLKKFI